MTRNRFRSARWSDRFDRMLDSSGASVFASLWGLAEATFFFIVPDVWMTAAGARGFARGAKAATAALLGAIAGGAIMYTLGLRDPETMRRFLDCVPAISPGLIEDVSRLIDERGVYSVLIGPLRGTPYKVFAAEWGVDGRNILALLVISVPARMGRFLLSVAAARLFASALGRLTEERAELELCILGAVWATFYIFYFLYFGW